MDEYIEYYYKMLKITSQVKMETDAIEYIIKSINDVEMNKTILYGAKSIS